MGGAVHGGQAPLALHQLHLQPVDLLEEGEALAADPTVGGGWQLPGDDPLDPGGQEEAAQGRGEGGQGGAVTATLPADQARDQAGLAGQGGGEGDVQALEAPLELALSGLPLLLELLKLPLPLPLVLQVGAITVGVTGVSSLGSRVVMARQLVYNV